MKSSIIGLIFLGIMMGSGCQNKELIQCQQDNASLQGQLGDSQKQMVQAKASGEQIANVLMGEMGRLKKDHESEIKQVHGQAKAEFDQRVSELNAKLTERTRELLKVRSTVKNKENEIKQINGELETTREKYERLTEMLQALGAQNEKLKVQIAELHGQIEANAEVEVEE